MIISAYAAILLCVERLFRALKPKLLMMKWFAKGGLGFQHSETKRLLGRRDEADFACFLEEAGRHFQSGGP
jgi:hypothetical protein